MTIERTTEALTRNTEPPVGTWAKDKFGGSVRRYPDGWSTPGFAPTGVWVEMWDARGPYVKCGPWGTDQ